MLVPDPLRVRGRQLRGQNTPCVGGRAAPPVGCGPVLAGRDCQVKLPPRDLMLRAALHSSHAALHALSGCRCRVFHCAVPCVSSSLPRLRRRDAVR
eukprot:51277-Rhodomonas_salina.1